MNKSKKLTTEKMYLFFSLKNYAQILFILFFLLSTKIYAQEDAKTRNFSIHIGVNGGVLGVGSGPSHSFNYAIRTRKVLQLESMLFYDRHEGKSFLSGHYQENWGTGLVVGLRINALPKKSWNPSLFVKGGMMYSSELISHPPFVESEGLSGAFSFGASINVYQKQMVSIGLNTGKNIISVFLKSGFWF